MKHENSDKMHEFDEFIDEISLLAFPRDDSMSRCKKEELKETSRAINRSADIKHSIDLYKDLCRILCKIIDDAHQDSLELNDQLICSINILESSGIERDAKIDRMNKIIHENEAVFKDLAELLSKLNT